MDDDGLLPDELEKMAKAGRARVLYVVPSLQNPTTHTMSRRRRDAIVAVARKYNLTIIEDDIFRLLEPRTQPPTFYSLAPERTFHITSFSKTLSPGLRIGIVVVPENQERALKSHVRNAAARTVGITGEMARYWIETDLASAILTRTRNELASRREAFLELFKGRSFRCEPGAPYAWLELPARWQPARFAATLQSHRIRISPGGIFNLSPQTASRHVRICFGKPHSAMEVRRALETIRKVMDEEPEDDFTPVA
jgi:DNA-binding transcriptional MocR family regulator